MAESQSEMGDASSTGGAEIVEEKLSRELALTIIFCCAICAALLFALYQRVQGSKRKATSLGIQYNLKLPAEREAFEKAMAKEPDDPKLHPAWHKEVCSILLRRAILDIGLHFKVSKDFQHHQALYQRGITLDIWSDVQKARKVVNRELELVKAEAEYLKPGWGNQIFAQAAQLRNHMEQMNQKQEMERLRKEELAKASKRAKKLKEQEEKLKAEAQNSERKKREKLADQLIREEEEQKRKTKEGKVGSKPKTKAKTN